MTSFTDTLKEFFGKITASQVALAEKPGVLWIKERGFENAAGVPAFARCWNRDDAALIVHLVNHAEDIVALVEAAQALNLADETLESHPNSADVEVVIRNRDEDTYERIEYAASVKDLRNLRDALSRLEAKP